jgi:transcriptional regulator with XRE-family HTH domain
LPGSYSFQNENARRNAQFSGKRAIAVRNYAKTFREALAAATAARGAKAELARKSGKSRSLIDAILAGVSVPGIDTAEELATALGKTLPEMLGEPVPVVVADHDVTECHRRVGEELARLKGFEDLYAQARAEGYAPAGEVPPESSSPDAPASAPEGTRKTRRE